jgi:uncharacterized protein YbbC (DUF1343 family)
MVKTGIERLLDEELGHFRGRRAGLVVHPASVTSSLHHTVDALLAAGADLRALFGPEHGILGEAQDMEAVGETRAPWAIPIYSLYGHSFESLTPAQDVLRGLDVLIIDLQDIGSRYYTFIYTMALCMKAAHEVGIEVVICDRPNPIGGLAVEGGTVEDGFRSFVGLWPMSNRHGLTIAEVARYLHGEFGVGAAPTIVAMSGWRRGMFFSDTGLPWVLPSPNMPTEDTALVYPGMCLVEGTELSEGRGTTRPFELFGAPFIEPRALAARLERESHLLPGVCFRPAYFKPTFHKHAGKTCGGVQLHVADRERFRPYRTGVACLWAVYQLYPRDFQWRARAYEFVEHVPAFDLLVGNARLRAQIEAGAPLVEIMEDWRGAESDFARRRAPYLLYET